TCPTCSAEDGVARTKDRSVPSKVGVTGQDSTARNRRACQTAKPKVRQGDAAQRIEPAGPAPDRALGKHSHTFRSRGVCVACEFDLQAVRAAQARCQAIDRAWAFPGLPRGR